MRTLMIIDMQKGFINKHNQFLVEKINGLLSQDVFDMYIYTKFKNHDGSPFSEIMGWNEMQNEDEQEPAVISMEPKVEYTKFTYGLGKHHVDAIKKQGVKEVYLCGTDIDACVLAIAYNLFDSGIKPILLKNYCGTSSENQSLIAYVLKIWKKSFGEHSIDYN